jgi:ABC-type uncharacterized transport system involved in gliding motility auxiliary subunit
MRELEEEKRKRVRQAKIFQLLALLSHVIIPAAVMVLLLYHLLFLLLLRWHLRVL